MRPRVDKCFEMESLIFHFLICSFFVISHTENFSQLYNRPRLPLSVVPYHYDVSVLTHLEEMENMRFEGQVEISLRILESTNLVVFHVANLTVPIEQIELSETRGKKKIHIIKTEVNASLQYLILQVESVLEVDNSYKLKMKFGRRFVHGEISSYFVAKRRNIETNGTSWYAVTHFERNYIRSALPSFDEPALRATFKVTLGHHKRFQSFSNMPMLSQKPNDQLLDYVWSIYEITPPMPTYILAYSVNEFKCRTSRTSRGKLVTFRTCQMGGPANSTFYLSTMAPELLVYYSELFDFDFPLEKIDQLVMRDETRGMENWGLILYGFMTLSTHQPIEYDYYKGIAHLVGHELVHMWFGNLVTVAWWSDFWLKEGFATYFSLLGVDHLHPDWHHMIRELTVLKQMAYYFDNQHNVPLSHQVGQTSGEQLAYIKSIFIIRMMHSMLGDEAFYEGLRSYLRQYAYGSTYKDELWIQLQRATDRWGALPKGLQVRTIMNSWTQQQGYPILEVLRNEDGKSVTLKQRHFSINLTRSELWWLPLTYTTAGERNFSLTRPLIWLKGLPSLTLQMVDLKDNWLIFDIQSFGYFRINYYTENWHLLAEALLKNHQMFPELNRVQLVSDSLFLYHQQQLQQETLHRLLSYLIVERSFSVWRLYIVELETQRKQEKFHLWLIEKVYNLYGGFQDALEELTEWNEINVVIFVMKYACSMNIGNCVKRAFKYLKNQHKLGQTLGKHLKSAIFCAAKCHGQNLEENLKMWLQTEADYTKFCPCPLKN